MDTIITFAKDWQAIIGIILAVAAFYGLLKKPLDKLGGRLDRLATRVDRLETDLRAEIGRLSSRIDGLSTRIDGVYQLVGNAISGTAGKDKQPDSSAPTHEIAGDAAGAQSPLTLTPKGQRIAERINAREIVSKYADKVLVAEDAGKLDIQQACLMFAQNMLMFVVNQQEKEVMKEAMYEEGGDPNMVYTTLGILLRDYYLEKRGFEVPVRKPEGEQIPPPAPPAPPQQTQQNHPHA